MFAFHQRALELFGQPDLLPDYDRRRGAIQAAAAAGITLPPAVAEWYGVPESSPVWRAFARYDEPLLRAQEGEPLPWWFGKPVRALPSEKWWSVPVVCHDLRGWIAGPILPLMGECVGSWWWGVALDGTADPRAVFTHDEGETWDLCGPSFSDFVRGTLFDATFDLPQGDARDVWLEGHQFYGPQRHQMREQFRAEPTTRVPIPHASELMERFSRDGQGVSICNLDSPRSSKWRLWASTRESFSDLVWRLSQIVPAFAGLTPMRGLGLTIPPGFTAVQTEGVLRGDSDIPF